MSTDKTTATFTEHTIEDAPEGSRAALKATQESFGFVPAALGRLAASPAAVAAFTRTMAIFEKTSFTPLEREVLAMTMGLEMGCEVCVALHSAVLSRMPDAAPVSEALRGNGALGGHRLEALRAFVKAALEHRGAVPDEALTAFLGAGFTREQALDALVGIAGYTLSTFANRLTRAPVDAPFASFAMPLERA
jgi:alkylhydroperoxidase family enzyme